MLVKYLYEDTKNKCIVGYDCRLPKAKEMAVFTAKVYKGKLLSEDEEGRVSLIEDFSNAKKEHKR